MIRLIDADALIARMKELRFNGELADYDREIHDVFESVAETTRTVYDVEKVVECIHEYFVQKTNDYKEDIVPHEILEYNKEICEIVRKGGVE